MDNRGTVVKSGTGKGRKGATVEPAWFVPTDQSYDSLRERLLSGATPNWSGKPGQGDAPAKSVTHRVTAVLDRDTGKVHLVSTFYNHGQVRLTRFDPELGRSKSVSLHDVLDARTEGDEPRYQVIGSARTKEPTEYYHQEFANTNEFREDFAKPVSDAQRAVQSTAAKMEANMGQAGIEQGARAASAIEEHPETGEPVEDHGAGETVAARDTAEPTMANNLDLDEDDVHTLVHELPGFESVEDLALMASSTKPNGEPFISPDLRAVMAKVLRQDPHFFTRVERDGLTTVLRDYGYNHETSENVAPDTGKGGQDEPSAVAQPGTGLPNPQVGGDACGRVDPRPLWVAGKIVLGNRDKKILKVTRSLIRPAGK